MTKETCQCNLCDMIEHTTWISVKERLPELGIRHTYLFVNGKGNVTYGYAYDNKDGSDLYASEDKHSIWINDMDSETNEVATHWMPLPKPPEKC